MKHNLMRPLSNVHRTVAIVRHGQYHQPENVPSAWLPHPLTDEGRAQARELADELIFLSQRYGWSIGPVIHSSQLLRAYETALICSKSLSLQLQREFEIYEDGDLNERSLGCAANLRVNQIEDILAQDPRHEVPTQQWKSRADYRLPLPGAESLRDAGRRVAMCIADDRPESDPQGPDGRGGTHGLVTGGKSDTEESFSRVLEVFVGHGAAFRFAAVQLGILSDAEALGCSMYHARPVIFECDTQGDWRHIEGSWKTRSKPGMD